MTLLFLAFYLPGMLFQNGSLEAAESAPARFMAQAILNALPQLGLFLYLLWLRAQQTRSCSPAAPASPLPSPPRPSGSGSGSAAAPEAPALASGAFARFGLVRWSPRDLLEGVLVFAGAAAVLLAAGLILSLLPSGSREFRRAVLSRLPAQPLRRVRCTRRPRGSGELPAVRPGAHLPGAGGVPHRPGPGGVLRGAVHPETQPPPTRHGPRSVQHGGAGRQPVGRPALTRDRETGNGGGESHACRIERDKLLYYI